MAGNGSDKGERKEREKSQEGPLISVIIPAYNCAGTIEKALDSALEQEVPLEVIVVDDGSGDGLDRVMAGYAAYPAIRCLKNEKNMGAAASRNRGVAEARGVYTAFLDADDWWGKGKLEKQLALMEKTGTVLCSTARELVTPEGKPTGRVIPVSEEITYRQLLGGNVINCSSVLLKTEVAREFPMCHEDSHEDYIMWLQILKKYGRACGINEPLLKYRLTDKGKSGSKIHSAGMTYKVYRYVGFGRFRSLWYFCRYAVNGVRKYRAAIMQQK